MRDRDPSHELVASLYQRYAPALFKYIFSALARREEAEDILVEVFLAALQYRHLSNLHEQQQLAWLFTVARNKLADWHRLAARSPAASLEQTPDFARNQSNKSDIPEVALLQQEEYALLHQQVARLPALQQEILRLRFTAGMRHREIAALLGKTESAIQTLFWRAIRSLRALYLKEGQSEKIQK